MENFMFQNPTKIIFGKGMHVSVGEETKKYGSKVLLHYGSGSIKKTGVYDEIIASLKNAGIDFIELGGVQPNPRLSLVRKGIEICKKEGIDFILAVGGGSVIDSSKAIGMGAASDDDVWDYYLRKKVATKTIPVGVVLTIAAAGSESSNSSVITNEEGWYKKGCNNEITYPKFAILNPELTYTLSEYQMVCGAADIFAHIMERYFTQVKHTELSDHLCEAAMKTLISSVQASVKHPKDYDARAELMWTGTIAHNNLIGMGRIGDWASHGIEHEISGIYDVAHGAGLAAVIPAWMTYVYKENITRFVQYAIRVWNVDTSLLDEEEVVIEGIRRTKEFFQSLGLPVSLLEMNVSTDHFRDMARKATERGPIGNFKKLYEEDVHAILMLAK